jgi:Flp pilus assembly pilin Flp
MSFSITSQKRKQRGQGMTEYIVIVALIAVAGIAASQFFGQTIRGQVATMAQEVAGKDANAERTKTSEAAAGAVSETKKKGLNDYNNNASRE